MAEAEERAQKRDRLESHLRRREEAWTEHTGTPVPSGMRRTWTEEYVSGIVVGEEADLELRRARAAAESPW